MTLVGEWVSEWVTIWNFWHLIKVMSLQKDKNTVIWQKDINDREFNIVMSEQIWLYLIYQKQIQAMANNLLTVQHLVLISSSGATMSFNSEPYPTFTSELSPTFTSELSPTFNSELSSTFSSETSSTYDSEPSHSVALAHGTSGSPTEDMQRVRCGKHVDQGCKKTEKYWKELRIENV